MNKENYFELAPTSEQTLKKHKYFYMGAKFINDIGHPCEYRVVVNNVDIGVIKYYRGRKLVCFRIIKIAETILSQK